MPRFAQSAHRNCRLCQKGYENPDPRVLICFACREDLRGKLIFLPNVNSSNSSGNNGQSGKMPQWKWPTVNIPSGHAGTAKFATEISALRMFGYTVGRHGWSESKRHEFLRDFMNLDLPKVVEQFYGNEYGSPLSTTRLRKMAWVIAGNCSARMYNPVKFRYAIDHWTCDLEFLKDKYYEDKGLKFYPWPDPRDV